MKHFSNNAPVAAYTKGLLLIGLLVGLWVVLLSGRATPALSQEAGENKSQTIQPLKTPPGQEAATFAAGCFWAREAFFKRLKGVVSVEPGYAGGHTASPTYEEVCTGTTGHAETVQIFYDPKVISYHDLLDVFFGTHDPITKDAQAPDEGTQYRSAIFYHSAAQKAAAQQMIRALDKSHRFSDPIVTEVVPYTGFYPAEAYHHNYFALNPNQPYCSSVVAPEVAAFEKHFRAKLK